MLSGAVDRRAQQIGAVAAPDELRRQAEIGQLDITGIAAVEFIKSGWNTADIEHEDIDRRLLYQRGEPVVAPQAPLEPQPVLTDRIIEITVEGNAAALRAHQREIALRNRHRRPYPPLVHLQIGYDVIEA